MQTCWKPSAASVTPTRCCGGDDAIAERRACSSPRCRAQRRQRGHVGLNARGRAGCARPATHRRVIVSARKGGVAQVDRENVATAAGIQSHQSGTGCRPWGVVVCPLALGARHSQLQGTFLAIEHSSARRCLRSGPTEARAWWPGRSAGRAVWLLCRLALPDTKPHLVIVQRYARHVQSCSSVAVCLGLGRTG